MRNGMAYQQAKTSAKPDTAPATNVPESFLVGLVAVLPALVVPLAVLPAVEVALLLAGDTVEATPNVPIGAPLLATLSLPAALLPPAEVLAPPNRAAVPTES